MKAYRQVQWKTSRGATMTPYRNVTQTMPITLAGSFVNLSKTGIRYLFSAMTYIACSTQFFIDVSLN